MALSCCLSFCQEVLVEAFSLFQLLGLADSLPGGDDKNEDLHRHLHFFAGQHMIPVGQVGNFLMPLSQSD
jgi:hypothetical protein